MSFISRVVTRELNEYSSHPQYLGRLKQLTSGSTTAEYRLNYSAFVFLDLAADVFCKKASQNSQPMTSSGQSEGSEGSARKKRRVTFNVVEVLESQIFNTNSMNLFW
jgi:hypothetical protein